MLHSFRSGWTMPEVRSGLTGRYKDGRYVRGERRRRQHAAARGKRNGLEAERTERPVRNAYTKTERAENLPVIHIPKQKGAERPARNAILKRKDA